MTGLIIFVHIIACALLIIIILIQRGRGGGLIESFSGLDSMFGTKTNTFLARLTAGLAVVFLISCLTLAVISARRSRSLIRPTKPSLRPHPEEVYSPPETPAPQDIPESTQEANNTEQD